MDLPVFRGGMRPRVDRGKLRVNLQSAPRRAVRTGSRFVCRGRGFDVISR
jgi:hypothetical protein